MKIAGIPLNRIAVPRYHYADVVRQVCGPSLIAYWPLWEQSGAVATDLSGNARHGVYTGVTLGQPGIGDGHTCPLFDGLTDYADLYSAGLAAAFNAEEGTLALWLRASGAGIWPDASQRYLAIVNVDNNNLVCFRKEAGGGLTCLYYANSAPSAVTIVTVATDWLHVALTWSKENDEVKAYLNGTQSGDPQHGLGVWAGVPTSTRLGAFDNVPNGPWSGLLAHAALCGRTLVPAEIAQLARVA